jgi:F-type H+-transporting ATPase subunit c
LEEIMKKWLAVAPAMAVLLLLAPEAYAQEAAADPTYYKGLVGIGVGLTMGLAVLGGGLGQGNAIRAALEGISRNPQASGKITVPMFAGLAFVESLVIFAFITAFFLVGKV